VCLATWHSLSNLSSQLLTRWSSWCEQECIIICRYGEDAVNYAFGLAMGGTPCDKAAVKMLKEVLEKVW
jgi:hypothetical protein